MSSNNNKEIQTIFKNSQEAEAFMISQFGKSESFDVNMKHIHIHNMDVFTININGLIDSQNYTQLLTNIQPTEEYKRNKFQSGKAKTNSGEKEQDEDHKEEEDS